MPRIVFVTRSAEAGGVEEHVFQLSVRALALQHHVIWVTLEPTAINPRFRRLPIRFLQLRQGGTVARAASELCAVASVLKRLKPNVTHVHGPRASLLGSLAAAFAHPSSRVVATMHASVALNAMDGGGGIRLAKLAVNKLIHVLNYLLSDQYIVVSNALGTEMRDMLLWPLVSGKMKVITNGVPLQRLRSDTATKSEVLAHCPEFDCTAFNIVCVGRLDPKKGQQVLLRALSLTTDEGPQINCHLIGRGSTRDQLESECASLGLKDRVFFWGHVDDACRFLRWFSALVLPSLTEGQGLVILEAMASRVPVLASGVGGIPEIIRGGAGLIAEPGRAESFARQMLRLRDEPDLRRQLAENAAIRVQAFDLDRKIDEVFACYGLCAQNLARPRRRT